ncbi:MAG: 2OG-Fe(II) oxygenase [Myxococcales bacterium]|nr:2OG-Fe(II) oxygenase [Myxococcales bacterium]
MYAGHFDFTVPMLTHIPALYSRAECASVLASVHDAEWLSGTVNRASGREIDENVRNNLIAIVRDPNVGATLWKRIEPHLPGAMSSGWDGPRRTVRVIGLFEPLRIYRYEVGHHFGLHTDQSYSRAGARSLLTLLLYLDDDFDGGETDFPDQGRTIAPRAGDALWFQHAVLHAGKRVSRGVKHVLRTDVLYSANVNDG